MSKLTMSRELRVLRGGSYLDDSRYLRTSFRSWDVPEYRGRRGYDGFRLVVKRRKPLGGKQ